MAAPGTAPPPEAAGWIGNEAWTYALLDERERAGEGADLMGSRLPPGNRMTTLIGLEAGPLEARARLLVEAFERYPGEEERGLREGYHARVRPPGGRYGGCGPAVVRGDGACVARETRREGDGDVDGGADEGVRGAGGRTGVGSRGIAQVRAEERTLLLRLAERRFGAGTAAQLSNLLAGVEEPEAFIEAGEWIVDCHSGDELLERCRRSREA